jgi:hypothetical protein
VDKNSGIAKLPEITVAFDAQGQYLGSLIYRFSASIFAG